MPVRVDKEWRASVRGVRRVWTQNHLQRHQYARILGRRNETLSAVRVLKQ